MSTSLHADDFDGLTGLYNSRYLKNALAAEVASARRDRRPLALIVFDVDDFRSVNDRFGHAVGDMLLRRIGERLREMHGATAIAARSGGDEFAVVLPDSTRSDALRVKERLVAAIRDDPMEWDVSVTLSAAIAQVEVAENAESFFRRADEALYQAKRRGA